MDIPFRYFNRYGTEVVRIMFMVFNIIGCLLVTDPPVNGFFRAVIAQHLNHGCCPTAASYYPNCLFHIYKRIYRRNCEMLQVNVSVRKKQTRYLGYMCLLTKKPLNLHQEAFVRQSGFEPETDGLENRCSIQLSYWRAHWPQKYNLSVISAIQHENNRASDTC